MLNSEAQTVHYLDDEEDWLAYQEEVPIDGRLENITATLASFLHIPTDLPVNREKVIYKICRYIDVNQLERRGREKMTCYPSVFVKDKNLLRIFPGAIVEYYGNIASLLDNHFVSISRSQSAPSLVEFYQRSG
jgi:hypothetical protein